MKKRIVILILFNLLNLFNLYSIEIKKTGKIELIQKCDLYLGLPRGFIVTENNSIVICDVKTADFKIYDLKGNAIKIFGRKGYGPDEFSSPWLHDYLNNRMLISESRTKKIFIYEKKEDFNWIKKNEINAVSVVDAKLLPDPERILFCCFPIPDHQSGKFYVMLTKTIGTNVKDLLLPFELQFGAKSKPVDFNKLRELSPNQMPDFIALPQWKYCDFYQDEIYFAWTGNLEIIKVNINNKKIDYFGRKTENYVKPNVSRQFKKAYLERKSSEYRNYIHEMSWVAKLFTDRRFIGVVYSNFDKETSRWNAFVQLYEHNGNFVTENQLLDYSSTYERGDYFYDKEKRILYCLSDDMHDGKIVFSIYMYKITE